MFITYSPSTRVFMVKNNLYWLSFLQHVSIFTHANFMLLNYFHRQLWVNKYLMGYLMSGHCCIECIRKKTNNKIADFHHSMVFFILLSLFFILFGRGQNVSRWFGFISKKWTNSFLIFFHNFSSIVYNNRWWTAMMSCIQTFLWFLMFFVMRRNFSLKEWSVHFIVGPCRDERK